MHINQAYACNLSGTGDWKFDRSEKAEEKSHHSLAVTIMYTFKGLWVLSRYDEPESRTDGSEAFSNGIRRRGRFDVGVTDSIHQYKTNHIAQRFFIAFCSLHETIDGH